MDVAPAYEYKDGRRTERVTGYRYIVALLEHGLEKIGVKIDEERQLEKPEGYAEVSFTGLEVSADEAQGHTQVTAKATGVSLVGKKA